MADKNENEKTQKDKVEDSDWKAEAKAEKEKLEEEVKKEMPHASLPPPSFSLHLSQIATQAFIFLGIMENPVTGKAEADIEQAKYVIDTLQLLKEKTEGNLTKEETELLDKLLYDLRIQYVQMSK